MNIHRPVDIVIVRFRVTSVIVRFRVSSSTAIIKRPLTNHLRLLVPIIQSSVVNDSGNESQTKTSLILLQKFRMLSQLVGPILLSMIS